MDMKKYFDKPKVIGICANINEGKSNLIYYLIQELKKQGNFSLHTYGLKIKTGGVEFHSIAQLEQIKNSIIFIDESFSLWDLDDRTQKGMIENTLRLVNHNNNILVICGLPENFKKFLSAKLDMLIFKKIIFADLINGSRVKNIVSNYKGVEKGTAVMNLNIDECLIYDGLRYDKVNIPYLKQFDTKKDNVDIFVRKNVRKKTYSKR